MRGVLISAALLLVTSNVALAATPREVLLQQRTRINDAIDARNHLLDRIQFAGHNNDSVELASINSSELTVVYALQALEDVLGLVDNKTATAKNGLKKVGDSMLMVCQAQVEQMDSDSAQLDDLRIRKEVDRQVDNVRSACRAIVAVTS